MKGSSTPALSPAEIAELVSVVKDPVLYRGAPAEQIRFNAYNCADCGRKMRLDTKRCQPCHEGFRARTNLNRKAE